MAQILAISNHKGGVGKTSTTVNLADSLSREGLDVLLVDLDPQANATALVYPIEEAPSTPVEKVLAGEASIAEAIITNTRIPHVHLLGSTLKLGNLERNVQTNPFASTRMVADKLRAVADAYDVILIDCPPSLSFLAANALAAADMVVVPIESGSKLSLIGSDDMLDFMAQAGNVNPRLRFGGALLTRHDGRKKVCQIVAGAIADYYQLVLDTTIPESTEVKKAQIIGKTILQLNHNHTVARVMGELARELMGKLGLQRKARKDVADE